MDYYREEILEHYRHPHNFGELSLADKVVEEANPLCGDKVKIYLKLKGKKGASVIENVVFTGEGCVLSTASASMLTDFIKGKTVQDIKSLSKEDVLALFGVRVNPARVKCVLLPLEALRRGLDET